MLPSLVILAAGLGSRFGGLKQLEPFGPHGQTILDYSIYDARRAGFGQVVFIIRREFAEAFQARLRLNNVIGGLDVRYVFQEIRDLPHGFTPPTGREKPWGTAHAVWCARQQVDRPFAVVNADDFYGLDAFRRLAAFLATANASAADFALVGYQLGQTLSEHGTVSRGVCRVNAEGFLTSIEEQLAIEPDPATGGGRSRRPDGSMENFPADTLVSMNCWAFTPAVFPQLNMQLHAFLRTRAADMKSEIYLPAAIGKLLAANQVRVRVLPTTARWCGVTYPEDKAGVQALLLSLHQAGEYPENFS
jgi:NDP-sugar pyrophosphorylase family protein